MLESIGQFDRLRHVLCGWPLMTAPWRTAACKWCPGRCAVVGSGRSWAAPPLCAVLTWPYTSLVQHKIGLVEHESIHDPAKLALGQKAKMTPEMEATAEPLILKAGQISLHDVYMLHGSEPNNSSRPRRGMTLRYMPTTSLYDRGLAGQDPATHFGHTLFLMRGQDRGGNDYHMHNAMWSDDNLAVQGGSMGGAFPSGTGLRG